MIDYAELVARLRQAAGGNEAAYVALSADAIESLQAECERLRGHIEDIAADARRDALDEAAKVCEHNASLYPYLGTGWESSIECADAIRVLKEKRDE